MIELRALGQLNTPPSMVPFVDRLKFNYERTVKSLMKATPRGLDSMLRSVDQILSNESTLQARARSVRELRNLPDHEKTAELRGYYEAVRRAIAVIKSGEASIPAQPTQTPSSIPPQPSAPPFRTTPAFPDITPPAEPPPFTMPPPPSYTVPVEPVAPPRFELPPEPPPFTMPTPPSYVSPVEPVAPPRFELPPEPPPVTMPSLPPSYVSPVEPATPPGAIKLLKMPAVPYSETFKQILSDAIKAAFRTLNLGAPSGAPGVELSKAKLGHIINVTYEIANKAGKSAGYKYSTLLIRDALQWRHITAQGHPAQLPIPGTLSPYSLSPATMPVTPSIPEPTQPRPATGPVPGLIPVGPPAKIMDARFLSILNKWMDHFLKGQRYRVRPTDVWYIPRHMMERFVKEIGAASNREGGKYGYTYDKGLVWDALQRRGYEPDKEASGAKRNPWDKKVQISPYDQPGSSVPSTGRQVISPISTPTPEIPDMPTPTAPTPPIEREETYAEKLKRLKREAEAHWAPILKEREEARKLRDDLRRKERAEKKRLKALRPKRYLPTITPAQYAKYQDMLNQAIDNRLQVAKWPSLPGKIVSVPGVDYEKLIASVQTFANMMAATIRETYHRFSSDEVGDAIASRGYVRGEAEPWQGAIAISPQVESFDDYKELIAKINAIRQSDARSLPRLIITPTLGKPLKKHLVGPILESQGCFDIMQRAIDQLLMRRRWEARPLLEKILSPAAHAGLVQQVWQYANAQYGASICPFTQSYTRDSLIKRGYLPHPVGTSIPGTPRNLGPSARLEEKYKARGQAIYPWEVPAHFPAHFQ